MLPSIDEAIKELEVADKLNPGPWVKRTLTDRVGYGNDRQIH